ncbi:MAG TPA: MFS transporter [Thermoplasmata archaeon]|nr:MFS transporter [Thermoplasmata archaeon]
MEHSIRTLPARLVARPWLLAFVPINAATAGFGVALPLYVLIPLHGGWGEVALAASLFNGAIILSSIFWGYVADRFPARRPLLLLNYAGFAALYAVLDQVTSLPLLFAIYVGVGILAPAGATAANLLVLEQFSEAERPGAYASLQEMSMIGSMGGLLVGYFWLLANAPLAPLFLVLGGLAATSVVAVYFGVGEAGRRASAAAIAQHPDSLAARFHQGPFRLPFPYFPVVPHISRAGLRRFRRWLGFEIHGELPLILAAGVLFSLAANLFNISYVPYLQQSIGLDGAAIFLINFANNVAQGLSFPASGALASSVGADRMVQRSTYLRSLGYLAVTGSTFVPLALSSAFGMNLLAFSVLGVAIALYTTSSSLILFRALEGRDAGRLLGLSSALGGVAAVGGAILSGVLSFGGNYRLPFLVSAAALLVSLPLWTGAQVAYARRRRGPRAAGTADRTGETD